MRWLVEFSFVMLSSLPAFADRDTTQDEAWDDESFTRGAANSMASIVALSKPTLGASPYKERVGGVLRDLKDASEELGIGVRYVVPNAFQRSRRINNAFWDSLGEFKREVQKLQDSKNLTDGIRRDHLQMHDSLSLKLKDLRQRIERLRPPG